MPLKYIFFSVFFFYILKLINIYFISKYLLTDLKSYKNEIAYLTSNIETLRSELKLHKEANENKSFNEGNY
jgi:hypothetical protein